MLANFLKRSCSAFELASYPVDPFPPTAPYPALAPAEPLLNGL